MAAVLYTPAIASPGAIETPAAYARAFAAGVGARRAVRGVYGRVLRGPDAASLRRLTDDPDRDLVLVMGPAGLADLLGRGGRACLERLGYHPGYIQELLDRGVLFRLVVFRDPGDLRLATWEGTVDAIADLHPEVARRLRGHLPALRTTPFTRIDATGPVPLAALRRAGPAHPAFVDRERFLHGGASLWEARAFLYLVYHLRELYSGDGFTYDATGARGVREFVGPDRAVADLPGVEVLDLEVR